MKKVGIKIASRDVLSTEGIPLNVQPRNLFENRHFGVYVYLFKIEKSQKNKHSHMFDIGVYAYLRALFFCDSEEFGRTGTLGQPPSRESD